MQKPQRVDRSELQFVSMDAPDDSVLYWSSRSMEERLEGIHKFESLGSTSLHFRRTS